MLTRSPLLRQPTREPKPAKGPRRKLCACCRVSFVPMMPMGRACSIKCAISIATEARRKAERKVERAERAETKAKLIELEPLEYWLKRAEKACNAYIRKRDEGQGCISCGRHNAEVWNAGHFVSVGANRTLRFNEDNIHLQCARPCNKDKGGNIHEYRKGLLKKIGPERLAVLDGWHPPEKMTIDKAQGIEAYFKAKLKEVANQRSGA